MRGRAHQVLVSASPGDAVTNEAFALRRALRATGDSDLFAWYRDPALAGEVLPLAELEWRSPARAAAGDLLVVHASIGEPAVAAILAGRPERLVLVYHNISPAEAFRPYDRAFAALLDAGRQEVAALAPRVALALADSAFNAADLESLGYCDVRVSPLVVDVRSLTREPADLAGAAREDADADGPVLLFVGQLLPHKRPERLIQAFCVLSRWTEPAARLVLVGPARVPAYARAVHQYVQRLGLRRATITGPVPDAELASWYRRADAFVTASDHEGFCVPLLEAMAFDVPVVARACGAIPETAGDAALVLPPDDDPVLLAEAMGAVLTDGALRRVLVERGRARVGHYDAERSTETFLRHLTDVA